MKKIILGIFIFICGFIVGLNSVNSSKNKDTKDYTFKPKKITYAVDDTTSVLVDDQVDSSQIDRVVKHGDHWHVFTKDGKEHITYTDPSKSGGNINNLGIVKVVKASSLIGSDVRSIKRHGDHYHVYLGDGSEVLTYDNPSSLFPHINIEEYNDSHISRLEHKEESPIVQDDNDPKRIVKALRHGDHWHLIMANGEEADYIYRGEDPRKVYPGITIGEYLKPTEEAKDDELFTYEEVEAKLVIPKDEKVDVFSNLLPGLVGYGDSDNTFGKVVKFSEKQFIVPHINHYHNVSIKDIASFAKSGTFGKYSAKDVVATFKYYILHPEEKPTKAGWGKEYNNKEEKKEDDYKVIEAKKKFVAKYYGVVVSAVNQIGDDLYVYFLNDKEAKISLSDLEVTKDGKIEALTSMPPKGEVDEDDVKEWEDTDSYVEGYEKKEEYVVGLDEASKLYNMTKEEIINKLKEVVEDEIFDQYKFYKSGKVEDKNGKTYNINL